MIALPASCFLIAFLCGAAATDQLLAGEAEGRLPGQAHPYLLLGQRGKCVAHLICFHLIVKMHTNSPSDEELRVQQTDISHRLEKVRKTFYHGVGCNVLLVSYRVQLTSVHLRSALARLIRVRAGLRTKRRFAEREWPASRRRGMTLAHFSLQSHQCRLIGAYEPTTGCIRLSGLAERYRQDQHLCLRPLAWLWCRHSSHAGHQRARSRGRLADAQLTIDVTL